MRRKSHRTPETALAHELLAFAITKISREARELALAHRHPDTGKIEPQEVAEEIREDRAWLRRARAVVGTRKAVRR